MALFIGKNPWQSHGIARARVVLKEIAKDPNRTMIVIDPRVSETAAMADIHLAPRPGSDACLLTAILAVIVQEGLHDEAFVAAHTTGFDAVGAVLEAVSVAKMCARCEVPEEQVRAAARIIGGAERLSSFEDLGVQMNRHSTLVSYQHKLLWALTGNFGKPGTHFVPTPMVDIANGREGKRTSPVVGARIIGGMVPCNVIAEEILTDHPDRYRAMIVEAANPAHSLADSRAFTEALDSLDTVVVIDVAMTETARHADYVLPAATQYEKAEATFFNFEFPENVFHLRQAILTPPEGVLSEAEIHARLVEAIGAVSEADVAPLRAAAAQGLEVFGMTFATQVLSDRRLSGLAPALLYRALGPQLPAEKAEGAVVFGLAAALAMKAPDALARAGFDGGPLSAAVGLFEAILGAEDGVVFSVGDWGEVRSAVKTPDKRIQLQLDDLLEVLAGLADEVPEAPDPAFPLVLSAGERRGFTANTIIRDPAWRKKDPQGSLRVSADDASRLGLVHGGRARLTTPSGQAEVRLEVSEAMRAGHVSLPNGQGLDFAGASNGAGGIAPNTLTDASRRDPFAGTPWHKRVPARLEALDLASADLDSHPEAV